MKRIIYQYQYDQKQNHFRHSLTASTFPYNIITNGTMDACPFIWMYVGMSVCVQPMCIDKKKEFENETRRCIKIKQKPYFALLFHILFFSFHFFAPSEKKEAMQESNQRTICIKYQVHPFSFTMFPFECIQKKKKEEREDNLKITNLCFGFRSKLEQCFKSVFVFFSFFFWNEMFTLFNIIIYSSQVKCGFKKNYFTTTFQRPSTNKFYILGYTIWISCLNFVKLQF